MSDLVPLVAAVGAYALAVLAIGAAATRASARSPEEYFLAGRGLRTVVLFMALFGTNTTTFVLVGIPALAYTLGVGVFGYNVPIIALGIPLTFWWIGSPARRMAKRLGALSPAEIYARRFDSRALGLVLFAAFTVWTLPYMLQAVQGAGLVLRQASGGRVPEALGSGFVLFLALSYTSLGGMRATAWTNVLQGALFLGFVISAFFLMSSSLGGLPAAMEAVRERDPSLLVVVHEGAFAPRAWSSWGLVIALTVIGFPHMLSRLIAARDERSLKHVVVLYPVALTALWLPVVLIGVWGAASIPGLERPDEVLFAMTARHMPAVFGAVAFVAVLAAVMSTLDAMLLTLSSMLVRDVLRPFAGEIRPGTEILVGRVFAALLAAAVYALALFWRDSIFNISRQAFEGYCTLVPVLALGARWRRLTASGAIASVLAGQAVLAAAWSGGFDPRGFLPAFWGLLAAIGVAVAVSLATPPQAPVDLERAFGPGESA